MQKSIDHTGPQKRGFLSGLAADRSGNALALVTASVIPLIALVGGGVDMGRSYLAESRLQQACDAGVLAARKKLGSTAAVEGVMPEGVAEAGQRFFNINFRDNAYGTENRAFTMTLEPDYSISGTATVSVPMTLMKIFGNTEMPLTVDCEAQLNFANVDVMLVVDTTASMNVTNPTDSEPRIEVLKSTVLDFYDALGDGSATSTRIRFGFVPYSTNVNVGHLLQSDWMVDEWTYQSRRPEADGTTTTWSWYTTSVEILAGTSTPIAPYQDDTCPEDTLVYTSDPTVDIDANSYYFITHREGIDYECTYSDGVVTVSGTEYSGYDKKNIWTWSHNTTDDNYQYIYEPRTIDVSAVKGAAGSDPTQPAGIELDTEAPIGSDDGIMEHWYVGCIEERDTYEIDDYDNVDFTRALDLDIDLVPTPGNPATQWRPQFPNLIFEREMPGDGSEGGFFTVDPVPSYDWFLNPGWEGLAACPHPAQKLAEMTKNDVALYLDSMELGGETHHDIGMIWGGRLISPTGLFADENANIDGKATKRHLIFLTDGQTMPLDINYSAYGVEPLDLRRWDPSAPAGGLSHQQVVEKRFSVACSEIKKKNITVWTIGFGTAVPAFMQQCAGNGHWFEAANASQLADAFEVISDSVGDLRLTD